MLPEDLGITREVGMPAELRAAISLILVLGALAARWLIVYEIRRRSVILSDRQRWWMAFIRNSGTALIVAGLFVLWAHEIQNFALSITAFAVALVFATKELLLCLSGALWRGTTRAFGVGDWVEIGGHSGEVIDETLMATQVQEIDPRTLRFTGRTISVPNGVLLTQPVINHNFRKRFLLHDFTLTAQPEVDALAVREAMQEALDEEYGEFAELAQRYASTIEKGAGVKLPSIEPEVRLGTSDLGNPTFRVTLFCPRERACEIEEAASRAFMLATRAARRRAGADARIPA